MSAPTPVRVVRSRVKNSRLTSPNGLPVVCVTRGTKWGNPMAIDMKKGWSPETQQVMRQRAVRIFRALLLGEPVDKSRVWVTLPYTVDDVKRELRGKNLACWCKESPCHADVLLEVANS